MTAPPALTEADAAALDAALVREAQEMGVEASSLLCLIVGGPATLTYTGFRSASGAPPVMRAERAEGLHPDSATALGDLTLVEGTDVVRARFVAETQWPGREFFLELRLDTPADS